MIEPAIHNSRELRAALDVAIIKVYVMVDASPVMKNAWVPLDAAKEIMFELEETAGHA